MDVPGRWNPVSFEQSLRGEKGETVKEEVRALVLSKKGVVVLTQDLA